MSFEARLQFVTPEHTYTRLLTLPLRFATLLTATVITSSERQCSHFRLKVLSLLPRQEDSSPF